MYVEASLTLMVEAGDVSYSDNFIKSVFLTDQIIFTYLMWINFENYLQREELLFAFYRQESVLMASKSDPASQHQQFLFRRNCKEGSMPEPGKHDVFSAYICNDILNHPHPAIKIQLLISTLTLFIFSKIILFFLNKFAHVVPEISSEHFYFFVILKLEY